MRYSNVVAQLNPDWQCLQDFRFLTRNIKCEWHTSAARERQVVCSRKYRPDLARIAVSAAGRPSQPASERGQAVFLDGLETRIPPDLELAPDV